jgi:hypothetical protein
MLVLKYPEIFSYNKFDESNKPKIEEKSSSGFVDNFKKIFKW